MKITNGIFLLFIFTAILAFVSCKKSTDDTPKIVELLSPTNITETGFTANWNLESSIVQSLMLEVATDNNFENLIQTIALNNTQKSLTIDNLEGATMYFHRIIVGFNDGTIINSKIISLKTAYFSEAVTFTTSDNLTIAGKINYLSSNDTPKPAIIFMHEMGVFINTWKGSDLINKLVEKGYVCMYFDFRGHGNSSSIADLNILIEDKSLIAKDLMAAMNFIKSQPQVDSSNIALVGASLGGIMAIAGNGFEEVRTSVSISGIRDGIYEIFPDMTISSALYISGELDIHDIPFGNFPVEAQSMYDVTEEPKKIIIIPGASAHGTALLSSQSLIAEITDWIETHINL